MSSQDILVIAVFGLVGYWCTAAVIRHFKMKTANVEADKIFSKEQAERQEQEGRDEREGRENTRTSDSRLHWADVLGVSRYASLDEIKAAYKKKISMYHPDKVSALGPEFNEIAQKKSKEINAAYDQAARGKS